MPRHKFNTTTDFWFSELRQMVPEFKPALPDDWTGHYGELLGHKTMGDLYDFMMSASRRGDHLTIWKVMQWINKAADANLEELDDMIGVSFMAHVPTSPCRIEILSHANEKVHGMCND